MFLRETHNQGTKKLQIILKSISINNRFGYSCNVCDRLWFEKDLKQVTNNHLDILAREFVDEDVSQFKVGATCWLSLNKQQIPALSRSTGFVYPQYPTDL
jgi:hypothetical protein